MRRLAGSPEPAGSSPPDDRSPQGAARRTLRSVPAAVWCAAIVLGAAGAVAAGAFGADRSVRSGRRDRRRCSGLVGQRARAHRARTRDRQPHERAETRSLGARDRAGRDRPAPLDGRRVPGRGHGLAHRADRALLGAARRAHRHGREVLRAPETRRAAARRRQGRDPRRDPAQARAADPRGARDRRDPRRGGPQARARLVLVDPRHGGDDRAEPPGEVGRQRLSARPEGRGDPDRGADRRRRRRLRRAHERPCLPQGVLRRGRGPDDARTARPPLRPGPARRLHGSSRPDRPGRPRGARHRTPRSSSSSTLRDLRHRP